jgi:hypothetical protein
MSVEFPLREDHTSYGPLLTPMIRLAMHTVYGWQFGWFVLDSGADFTSLPESLAEDLGVHLASCPLEGVRGIEGRILPARVGTVVLAFGKELIAVRCHFLKSKNAPYILGRMDVFSRFNIYFNNKARKVVFTAIR